VAEVLPLLYLHGLSSDDFGPALEPLLGCGTGLSEVNCPILDKSGRSAVTTRLPSAAAANAVRRLL
jgi:hypothetical protein